MGPPDQDSHRSPSEKHWNLVPSGMSIFLESSGKAQLSLSDFGHAVQQPFFCSRKRTVDEVHQSRTIPQTDSWPSKQPHTIPHTGSRPSKQPFTVSSSCSFQASCHTLAPGKHVSSQMITPVNNSPDVADRRYDVLTESMPSETTPVKQPPTRPISEQQLINEVKGIYAGLVMAEKKCVDIINQQNQSTNRLTDQQWKALVALHRTLLQEHHGFPSASQYPTASDSLKKLAIKYAMPARMWRHGIHAFLELLRYRLPDSMDYMLSYIYLAYSMIALLKESVPSFVETWIECLGDLARYRMAIEDTNSRDREIWSDVAKMLEPFKTSAGGHVDRAGPRFRFQGAQMASALFAGLFDFGKDDAHLWRLYWRQAEEADESVMLLFDMFSSDRGVQSSHYSGESTFIRRYALLFSRRNVDAESAWMKFDSLLVHTDPEKRDKVCKLWEWLTNWSWPRFELQGPRLISTHSDNEAWVTKGKLWPGKSHFVFEDLQKVTAADKMRDNPKVGSVDAIGSIIHKSHQDHNDLPLHDYELDSLKHEDGTSKSGALANTAPIDSRFRTSAQDPQGVHMSSQETSFATAEPLLAPLQIQEMSWYDGFNQVTSLWKRVLTVISGFPIVTLVFSSLVQSAAALESEERSSVSVIQRETQPDSEVLMVFVFWVICISFSSAVFLLRPKIKFENPAATLSIAAFMTSIAMGACRNQSLTLFPGAIFGGLSLGSSIDLARITRTRSNSTLVAFARYIVPAVAFWNLLETSGLSENGRPLDLSLSIPYLSVFGSVGVNALVNEKYRELKDGLLPIWEKIMTSLGLEYARQGDESSNV